MKTFPGRREQEQGGYIRQKSGLVMAMLISFRKANQVDYLTSADMVIPNWFKILFLGEPKLELSLGLVIRGLA